MTDGQLWRDKETLDRLYWEEGMSQSEIADKLGCSSPTITRWMDKLGVESRTYDHMEAAHRSRRINHATFYMDDGGYERWSSTYKGNKNRVRVHRLLAVAEYGFEAVVNGHVHHENRLKWDNRPTNIGVLDPGDHHLEHIEDFERREDGTFKQIATS